jgi:putative FmdB family regulatory protein
MPIFEYQCLECDHRFEHLQRTGDTRVACPICEAENVERLVSLCSVSSEVSRAANLTAAHQRAAQRRGEKQRGEHKHHHDHFEDAAKPKGDAG